MKVYHLTNINEMTLGIFESSKMAIEIARGQAHDIMFIEEYETETGRLTGKAAHIVDGKVIATTI